MAGTLTCWPGHFVREEPVLTAQQLDHFATFGFVVLPGMLGRRRTAALRALPVT